MAKRDLRSWLTSAPTKTPTQQDKAASEELESEYDSECIVVDMEPTPSPKGKANKTQDNAANDELESEYDSECIVVDMEPTPSPKGKANKTQDNAANDELESEYDSECIVVDMEPTPWPKGKVNNLPPSKTDDDGYDSDHIVIEIQPPKRKLNDITKCDTGDVQQQARKKARVHASCKPATFRQVSTATNKSAQKESRKEQPNGSRTSKRRQRNATNACEMEELFSRDDMDQQQTTFKELSDAEFKERLHRPIAHVKCPPRDKQVESEYDSMPQAYNLHMKQWIIRQNMQHQDALGEQEMVPEPRTAYMNARPKRATVKRTYVHENDLDEDSDGPADAIAPKRTRRRNVRSRNLEDPDFSEDAAASSVQEEEDDVVDDSEHSDSEAAVEEENEEDEVKPEKSKSKLAATNNKAMAKPKKSRIRMKMLIKRGRGMDSHLPPCSDVKDIFADMTKRALDLKFDVAAKHLASRPLRVATMCSGTESPLLALQMVEDCLKSIGEGGCLHVEHLFSAEIVPFKQAFIDRNFHPPIIFRDITEMTTAFGEKEPMATTAYGGKVPIPRDLDMLIAGTSCVDFSGQNSHKKGLDDGGESGDTFHAVLAFCRADRPGIVILENVCGAPYDDMMKAYEDIGYEVAGVLVDTKDYYLPQTRERGYMIAFDKEKLRKGGAASKWESLMKEFQRPASSSVSTYLLPRERLKARTFRHDEDIAREVDWSTCEVTQADYRQRMRLGMGRPYTGWSATGSSQPPDYSHQDWVRNGVERVKDTMDAAIVRRRLPKYGMCDIQFKTRVIDLSQNVYREEDKRPFGIVGCLTPSGQFWISDAGRQLAPEESLQLQGLPLHKISLTTETPAQIQDLAGNAMSSTVIGSAILSALIAGYVVVPDRHLSGMGGGTSRASVVSVKSDLTTQPTTPIQVAHNAMELIRSKARQAVQRCYCEADTGLSKKPIQECEDCGHTTCTGCGGNPAHSYRLSPTLTKFRLPPHDFEQELRAAMPLCVRIASDSSTISNALGVAGDIDKQYLQATVTAMTGLFILQDVKQTNRCDVTYRTSSRDGGSARLVLRITESGAEWRLYAHAPPRLPVNSALRRLLNSPVAKMTISNDSNDLYTGQFVLRVPPSKGIPLLVQGTGDKIASRWQRDRMPDFTNHVMWQYLTISIGTEADKATSNILNGRYRYLPSCGTANGSLYVKDADTESSRRPVYLFLDPDRVGNPEDDCFVFSHSNARLEYGEVRDIIARIMPNWRAYGTGESSRIPASTNAKLMVEATWRPLPCNIQLAEARTNVKVYEASTGAASSYSQACSQAFVLLRGSILFKGCTKEGIIAPDDEEFLTQHAAICESLRRHIPADHWQSDGSVCDTQSCSDCAPSRPSLRWDLSSGSLKPYEDHASATVYEHYMKTRPNPLFLSASISGDRLQLDVIANIATLKHRAVSRLKSISGTMTQVQWRITTCRDATQEPAFRIPETKPTQLREIAPTILNVALFPKQQVVVDWMMKQESNDGAPFELDEVEEASLPAIGLRLEVRASTTMHMRGGYCADHPGFGKTLTSLALIYSQLQEPSSRRDIIDDLNDRQGDAGLIATAATLVVCPHTLVKQWVSEISEKVRTPGKVISIAVNAELSKYTLEDFKKASIVVVNRNLFSSDAYTERLASFAAVPGPAATSGRAFSEWLKDATAIIPEHLSMLRPGGLTEFGREHVNALKHRIRSTYKENIESEKYRAIVPSRRLRGADYVANKSAGKSSSTSSKPAAPEIETTTVGQPLFELFYWNRLIVDEAHLLETKEHAAIVNLRADKRWALSATPALGDCVDTFHIAALLGIPLRMGRIGKGDVRAINLKRLQSEMTSFELFDAMRATPSDLMQSHVIGTHQNFLDAFVRRNIMDYDAKLKYEEHLVPVTLGTPLMALYNEVSQHLTSLAMRIRTSKKNNQERQRRLNRVIDESDSPEEALSKSATHLELSLDLACITDARQKESSEVLEKLRPAITIAKQKEKVEFDSWQKTFLADGALEDQLVIKQICAMTQTTGKAKHSTEEDDNKKGRGGGDKVRTAAVNVLATRLLMATRSARYMESVAEIQKAFNVGHAILCETPGCQQKSTDLAANAHCGHSVCAECHKSLSIRKVTTCPASGCSGEMTETNLFWVGRTSDPALANSVYGAKIEATLKILKDRVQARGEQAILCVQFESQLAVMEAALKYREITASVVKNTSAAADMIADFRDTAGTTKHKTVLVLNISDETAAGSNIQTANHVIMLSPLLRDSQYNYESTMQQVIGRVRRPGQKKQIHVWRIAARNTVDVDVLEHRERRSDAMVEYGDARIQRPAALEKTAAGVESRAERTQLVRENGKWSLRPQSWLVGHGQDGKEAELVEVQGKKRVSGWDDFTSLVKFSRAFADDGD